jgi:hypothetical protein
MRLLAAALLAALLSTPGLARADDSWGLSLQLLGGVSRYDVGGLKAGIANQGAAMLKENASMLGGMALLRLGAPDLGVIYEGGKITSSADSAVLTPVVGLALPLGETVRIDLLGELGGHKISNISTTNNGLDYSQAKAVWLPYVGARPMLTLRLPVGPVKLVGVGRSEPPLHLDGEAGQLGRERLDLGVERPDLGQQRGDAGLCVGDRVGGARAGRHQRPAAGEPALGVGHSPPAPG